MRIWLACFFVLFALAELFDWVKQINLNLPLPIYILGGALLAVVSNYNKIVGYYLTDTGSNVIRDILPQQPQLETSPHQTPIPSITNQTELQLPDAK
jgi:hypothetical protein